MSCSAPMTVQSPDGAAVVVNYTMPAVAGGTLPLGATSCMPSNGSTFDIGTTIVECTVQDADQRSASCSFPVTVTPPPTLTRTKFMAFGDSLTDGSMSLCFQQRSATAEYSLLDDIALIRSAVNVPVSYPSQLEALLRARYSTQAPIVINEGWGGETADETRFSDDYNGIDRLPDVLSQHQPEVLLLMEGINDIHQGTDPGDLVDTLRRMVQQARSRGVLVYLGTLLPQRAGACRNFAPPESILETNDGIRNMGFLEGALIVDLYAALAGQEDTLLGPDGLHPNEAGYRAMAEAFQQAIQATLEAPPSGLRPPAARLGAMPPAIETPAPAGR
jgi:lysophospholipase L1-like esterase